MLLPFSEKKEAELVQATNENIREYQEAVENVVTEDIANFTSALTVAFELLKEAREEDTIRLYTVAERIGQLTI